MSNFNQFTNCMWLSCIAANLWLALTCFALHFLHLWGSNNHSVSEIQEKEDDWFGSWFYPNDEGGEWVHIGQAHRWNKKNKPITQKCLLT